MQKEKVLELLRSVQGLEILEVTDDSYWHYYAGRIADVLSWVSVCHTSSKSIKSANALLREIRAKLEGQEGFHLGIHEQVVKWKDGVLHLGAVITVTVIGTQRTKLTIECTDPEVANLKSKTVEQYSFVDGLMERCYEQRLTRAIVIVVFPDREIRRVKKLDFPPIDFKGLKIRREDIQKPRSKN